MRVNLVPDIEISELVFDEDNEEALRRHGIAPEQLMEVLSRHHVIVPSKAGSYASHKVIGRDADNSCLVLAITATHRQGTWKPLATWLCSDDEERLLSDITDHMEIE